MGPHFYASLRLTQLEDQGLKNPTDEWINGLKDKYRLILVDYPRGMGQTPNPIGLADKLPQPFPTTHPAPRTAGRGDVDSMIRPDFDSCRAHSQLYR